MKCAASLDFIFGMKIFIQLRIGKTFLVEFFIITK